MTRFNSKYGAIALLGLAAIYMIISLATGRSAASQIPPDLSAPEAGINVWQATALIAKQGDAVVIVDVRPREQFDLYHLPRSVSKPGADAKGVLEAASGKSVVVIVGDTDAMATKIAAEVSQGREQPKTHFLREGVRAWYLTYEVPVPLFNDEPPPYGWTEAMRIARAFVEEGKGHSEEVINAVGKLSEAEYAPTQLEGKSKASDAGGEKKKITGGCG